nr:diguanylate cyclase [Kineococcus aurantiacus]
MDRTDPATTRLLDGFPDPAWSVDDAGRAVAWNRAAEDVLGHRAGDVLGRDPGELLGPVPTASGPVRLRDAQGRPVPGSVLVWTAEGLRHATLRVADPDVGAVGRRLLEGLLAHVSDAVTTLDADGTVRSLNRAAEQVFGVRAADVVGHHVRVLTRFEDTDDYLLAMGRALRSGEAWHGVEVHLRTLAGRPLVLHTSATALSTPGGGYAGAVVVSRDVTPVRELERSLRAATSALRERATELARSTRSDALTGVAARGLLQERLAAALSAAAGDAGTVCVLAADLEGFRAVNESYGLATGDAVLTAFAAHLRSVLPPGATAGRLGADEFAVVLPGTGEPEAAAVARAVRDWTPPAPLPSRGRRPDDPDVGVTVALVRATAAECRSPFDTGVRSVLQRAEDAVAAGKGARG